MPEFEKYTSKTSEKELDKILRYFESTVEDILIDGNQARILKLSQTLQKISTLQHLAKASKKSENSQAHTGPFWFKNGT